VLGSWAGSEEVTGPPYEPPRAPGPTRADLPATRPTG
jgi:hypothetical protein